MLIIILILVLIILMLLLAFLTELVNTARRPQTNLKVCCRRPDAVVLPAPHRGSGLLAHLR